VIHAATHKFFDVGVPELGDVLNNLQEFSRRHFSSVTAKLQY